VGPDTAARAGDEDLHAGSASRIRRA
jgi:hypothetical protein